MGNTICGAGSSSRKTRIESHHSILNRPGKDEADIPLTIEELDEHRLDQLLKEMKEYHLNRMRHEIETDPQIFILDNLLLCIQFFDNFERSKEEANQFKFEKEKEMTELLAKDPLDGQILGDRRIKLLTGISHVLAQNYIYKGQKDKEEEDEVDLYYGGLGYKDTFMAEGILPLDFKWTWDNLELYDMNEYKHLIEYSNPKGESPVSRFCVENPENSNDFGYVRLRCVDEPIHLRRKLNTPPSHSLPLPPLLTKNSMDGEESVYSKPYSDDENVNVIQEAESDSDEQHDSGPTSDDDDPTNLVNILNALPRTKIISGMDDKGPGSPTSRNRPKLAKLNLSQGPPSFAFHAPTPPVHESTLQMQGPFENLALLHPPSKRGRIYDQPQTDSLPRDSPVKEISSGYDTTSTISQSSSIRSDQIRDKWQKLNLKKLWEFGKKSRKDLIVPHIKYDPIPPNCYSEIKYEFSYDELNGEDGDEDDFDSDTDSDTSDDLLPGPSSSQEKSKKKRKKSAEDEYELRFYLNSSQMSSNACSEFHCHGPKLGISPTSLASGVVLGTTIRCPISYMHPKESEEEDESQIGTYYVTHTFTPTLHSKFWPNGLYNNFSLHVNSLVNQNRSRRDIWPPILLMEEMEDMGCDAIPLGFRPMEFFNTGQILEWELSFHECETSLLNTLRQPHWRAYIFASILFRAFIAPLGPQGIGLEHLRNVLYFMCHENFQGWEDEQPGLHLKILLNYLYTCMSRNYMPSFFIRGRNMLKSIPQQNLRFVQGNLHRVRENLAVYCIYAFRNLIDVRGSKASFPFPNFKELYEILTCQEAGLLKIINPPLRMQNDQEDQRKREAARQRARKNKRKKKQQQQQIPLEEQDVIDREYFRSERGSVAQPKLDPYQEKLRKRHDRYQKKLAEHNEKVKDLEKLKKDPEHRIPEVEKRKSIDLNNSADKFSPFRLLIIIQFFIKHFIDMAEKSMELRNFSNATMYTMQVENLCEMVADERWSNTSSPFEEEELFEYREKTLRLRAIMEKDMHQYILTRLDIPPSQAPYTSSLYSSDAPPGSPLSKTFPSNWDLRKLPTPPQSEKNHPPVKLLEKPNIASSLHSFDTPTPDAPVPGESANGRPRLKKQESIKFVSSVIPKETPPSTPPRSARGMRQGANLKSKMSIIELDTEVEESTDL